MIRKKKKPNYVFLKKPNCVISSGNFPLGKKSLDFGSCTYKFLQLFDFDKCISKVLFYILRQITHFVWWKRAPLAETRYAHAGDNASE